MLIFYERMDGEGRKTAGALDVIDLESFADQMIEFLVESPDGKIAIMNVDKTGSVVGQDKPGFMQRSITDKW